MSCSLLHIVEQPDTDPYRDPDVKDVVGAFPLFRCAQCSPLRPLSPAEATKCMGRDVPCWKPADSICED